MYALFQQVQTTISKVAQRKVCQRQRSNAKLPKDPTDYSDINASFVKTFDGRNFLLSNNRIGDDRILIFGTIDHLQRLSQSEVVILDGTFSSAPSAFRQVFTVHGSIGKGLGRKFAAFAHMLLPNKAEETYKKALKILKKRCSENGIELDPSAILTDFELAEMKAVQEVFPDSALYGCFFHLTKSWYKRIQQLGLSGYYAKSSRVQLAFWQTQALAFLDVQEVPEGLAQIKKHAPNIMSGFFDYISDNYVLGKKKKSDPTRRSRPRFPPEIWNMKQNLENNIPRTSNAIEGYHNKFNTLLKGGSQLKFYAVLKTFQQEEMATSAEYMRFLQGDMMADRRTKTQKRKEEKLRRLIQDGTSENIELFDHIQGLALALHNK